MQGQLGVNLGSTWVQPGFDLHHPCLALRGGARFLLQHGDRGHAVGLMPPPSWYTNTFNVFHETLKEFHETLKEFCSHCTENVRAETKTGGLESTKIRGGLETVESWNGLDWNRTRKTID